MAGIDHWAPESFTLQEFEDPALDPGPPVSLRSLKAAAKRRKRVWITTAFIGLILGASLHVLLPSKISAVSRVYLVEPANTDPSVAVTNDLSLLGTRKVAESAQSILRVSPKMPAFAYKGSAEGSSIIAIKATAGTRAEAVARTNAIATAFLQVRAQLQSTAAGSELAGLNAELRSLEADAAGAAPTRAANIQQEADIQQITTLKEQIALLPKSQSAIIQNSVVLDKAYVIPVSAKKTAVKDGLSGLIAGLGLGIMIVIFGELMSDRVRARSDVAAALGAPVELSVGRLP